MAIVMETPNDKRIINLFAPKHLFSLPKRGLFKAFWHLEKKFWKTWFNLLYLFV